MRLVMAPFVGRLVNAFGERVVSLLRALSQPSGLSMTAVATLAKYDLVVINHEWPHRVPHDFFVQLRKANPRLKLLAYFSSPTPTVGGDVGLTFTYNSLAPPASYGLKGTYFNNSFSDPPL